MKQIFITISRERQSPLTYSCECCISTLLNLFWDGCTGAAAEVGLGALWASWEDGAGATGETAVGAAMVIAAAGAATAAAAASASGLGTAESATTVPETDSPPAAAPRPHKGTRT